MGIIDRVFIELQIKTIDAKIKEQNRMLKYAKQDDVIQMINARIAQLEVERGLYERLLD